MGQYLLISYNGAPQSMKLTIEKCYQSSQSSFFLIKILSTVRDMRELGEFTEVEHRSLAAQAAQSLTHPISRRTDEKLFCRWLEKLGYNMQRVFVFESSKDL
jgi:UDP-N-acetylmuramyl pentapeptide synthase